MNYPRMRVQFKEWLGMKMVVPSAAIIVTERKAAAPTNLC